MRVACLKRRARDEKHGVAAVDTFDIVAFELLSSESYKGAIARGAAEALGFLFARLPLPPLSSLSDRAIVTVDALDRSTNFRGGRYDAVQ